jgi:spermidine synthase
VDITDVKFRRLPAFGLGFIALSWQILLMREFAVHFHGNEIVFGILLAAWLLWTGLGSLLAPRLQFSQRRVSFLYRLILLTFPFCLAILRFSRFLLGLLPGEASGLAPAVWFALALTALVCVPLGILFVFLTQACAGKLAQVYLWEALGSAAAGVVIYFLLIPRVSNWQAAGMIGTAAALAMGLESGSRKVLPALLVLFALMGGLWVGDLPSQKLFWAPYSLVGSRDTPYSKLQMLKQAEQLTLYSNCAPVYSLPDPAAAEEAVHFTLLQRPQAQKALLIGGGVGGDLTELLKYPLQRIDYVESDPEIIRFSRLYLPGSGSRVLENPLVHIHHSDGRKFLQDSSGDYDVIILDIPDPSTAQLNRYYTLEFFTLVRARLTPRGLLSFRVSSAENYIRAELQDYLASTYATLNMVFSNVLAVPGDSNIFLAADSDISLDSEALGRRIDTLNLNNTYITAALLSARLDPLRTRVLADALKSGRPRINRDLYPISYLFSAVLWSTQFRGLESRLIASLAALDSFWLLQAPLGLFLLSLIVVAVRGRTTVFYLVPLAVMGWTTIVCEVVAIFAFQVAHGSLYHSLALLFSAFMLGLTLGAWSGSRRLLRRFGHLVLLQGFLCLLVSALYLGIQLKPSAPFFLFFLILLGYLGGDLFVSSNRLYLQRTKNYGIGYGLDLLGSFLGALVTSSLLIPTVGLVPLTGSLLLANGFCLVFLLWGWRRV